MKQEEWDAKDKYNFESYCLEQGISYECEEDFEAWWECWKRAINEQLVERLNKRKDIVK